ncbi:Hypothetical predicted protein [Marmota monax]|uniref:Uncharacterized protein n=1 Tax=Marmota monax TaxID=9995 RepID=A0A5E4BHS0_MARMO|nr:Hypothetical predicted protein [Marmota monax]
MGPSLVLREVSTYKTKRAGRRDGTHFLRAVLHPEWHPSTGLSSTGRTRSYNLWYYRPSRYRTILIRPSSGNPHSGTVSLTIDRSTRGSTSSLPSPSNPPQ